MTLRFFLLISFVIVAISGCVSTTRVAKPTVGEFTITWEDAPTIEVVIHNQYVRLVVDPGAGNGLILNGDKARDLGISARGLMSNVERVVGTRTVKGEGAGKYAVRHDTLGEFTVNLVWFEGNITPNFDGVIGLSAIPAETIVFERIGIQRGDVVPTAVLKVKSFPYWRSYQTVSGLETSIQLRATHEKALASTNVLSRIGQPSGASERVDFGNGIELFATPYEFSNASDSLEIFGLPLTELYALTENDISSFSSRSKEVDSKILDVVTVTGESRAGSKNGAIRLGLNFMRTCSVLRFERDPLRVTGACGPTT